jgi:hypothetical protein
MAHQLTLAELNSRTRQFWKLRQEVIARLSADMRVLRIVAKREARKARTRTH